MGRYNWIRSEIGDRRKNDRTWMLKGKQELTGGIKFKLVHTHPTRHQIDWHGGALLTPDKRFSAPLCYKGRKLRLGKHDWSQTVELGKRIRLEPLGDPEESLLFWWDNWLFSYFLCLESWACFWIARTPKQKKISSCFEELRKKQARIPGEEKGVHWE